MAPPRKKLAKVPRKSFKSKGKVHPDDASSVSDASDMVDDDYGDRSFLLDYSLEHAETSQRKRRKKRKEEEEDKMEQMQRPSDGVEDSGKKLQFLLPLKNDSGVQLRYREVDQTEIDEKRSHRTEKNEKPAEVVRPKEEMKSAPFSTDPKWKQRVASLCYNVLENPESNLRHARELLDGLSESDVDSTDVKSVVIMASLTEVFKDILPGYRIHVATEDKTEQKLKKETIKLRSHEVETSCSRSSRYLLTCFIVGSFAVNISNISPATGESNHGSIQKERCRAGRGKTS